jgi:DNA processing protein
MITASTAHAEKRQVFAVPGDIYRPSSGGPNKLVGDGRAQIATSPEQLLVALGWSSRVARPSRPRIDRKELSIFESKIVDVLDAAGGPLIIDQIAERAGLDVQDLFSQLFMLEMKNIVRPMAGKQYSIV